MCNKKGQKIAKKAPRKSGFGGRQVGAFSIFWLRHTGIPFSFWRFFAFLRKKARLRGWCNTTPVRR